MDLREILLNSKPEQLQKSNKQSIIFTLQNQEQEIMI